MKLFYGNKIYSQYQFEKESDFEREVVQNSKLFFGQNSVYIDVKRKIEARNLGNTIPDGFLFDLNDKDNPEFYIIEVELAKHDFFGHIFPQVTKFFGFYKNLKSQNDLVEKIFSFISSDAELKKEFKKLIGDKEMYKFIKDTIARSQNVLLIIDGDKKELPEIIETYSDTWGKMLKLILLKKFTNSSDSIYTMHPEFENIEFAELENDSPEDQEEVEYDEEYHFDGVAENIKEIYTEIKAELLSTNSKLIFNPKKHYISVKKERNIIFFITGKKRIKIVVIKPEEETKVEIKHHPIKTLTPSVQKFWNGPSSAIIVENNAYLDEVKELLVKLVSK